MNNVQTECPACSRTGTERSNPQGEARGGELVSRNASELDSASLHKSGKANLPDLLKPATTDEATFACSPLFPRGDWRQRARKERHGNLGGPLREERKTLTDAGKAITWPRPTAGVGRTHSSEEGSNDPGAKGADCKRATINRSVSLLCSYYYDKTVDIAGSRRQFRPRGNSRNNRMEGCLERDRPERSQNYS